jgi:hypothetical protein
MPTKNGSSESWALTSHRRGYVAAVLAGLLLALTGCGEPSLRERENRRELEALLTAITLKNKKELDKDVKRIEERHDSGSLSDTSFKDLQGIFQKAQNGDWSEAEKLAYTLREAKPYFK